MIMDKIYVGTSGWGYPEWKGVFYPRVIEPNEYLLYYSEIYFTTEINTTFYQIPLQKTIKKWVENTPKDFIFSAKIPQDITHQFKLNLDKCSSILKKFLDVMEPLIESNKLLALLLQLPPSFNKNDNFKDLKDFIEYWDRSEKYERVIEFRHISWMDDEIFSFLKENQITYCGVIEPLLPPRMDITNPNLSYIRFHGYGAKPWFNYNFSNAEIEKWAKEIKKLDGKVKKIGIYFNNHFSGYAAKNSLVLMKELKINPRNPPGSIKLTKIKKKSGAIPKNQTDLNKFFKK